MLAVARSGDGRDNHVVPAKRLPGSEREYDRLEAAYLTGGNYLKDRPTLVITAGVGWPNYTYR